MSSRVPLTMAGVASLTVAAVVAGAVAILDAPTLVREKRLDGALQTTLSCIDTRINRDFSSQGALPEHLPDTCLAMNSGAAPIAYQRTGADSYRLCATWYHAASERLAPAWPHSAGHVCFERRATP